MKFLAILSLVTFSLSSFGIEYSTLHERHQSLIKETIIERCDLFGSVRFIQIANIEEPIRIDQGILNYDHITTLRVEAQESYFVTVESHYFDQYDHEARDWGSYLVASVKCEDLY